MVSVFVVLGLSCSEACGIFSGPGIEPMSPGTGGWILFFFFFLADGFLTTVPPGKSSEKYFSKIF